MVGFRDSDLSTDTFRRYQSPTSGIRPAVHTCRICCGRTVRMFAFNHCTPGPNLYRSLTPKAIVAVGVTYTINVSLGSPEVLPLHLH